MTGFGGAFTESAAYVWSQLNSKLQQEVIDAYFGPNGHHYTVCRTHINSCDFSLANFSFDDKVDDFSLQNFTVAHSQTWMFPFMKAAITRSKTPLKIFASPWSPPAWMKRNGQMNGSFRPCLKQDRSPDHSYHAAWALFFSKFISAYNSLGFKIWGVTIQNEPEFDAPWEACCYTPEEELDFLQRHLGPQLRSDHPDIKIMIYDHNKDHIVNWVQTIFSDPVGYSYADGTAFHWYSGPQFENVAKAHSLYPEKFLLATEATTGGPPTFGTAGWPKAESYAYDILGDLNNWAVGWVDWNMLLDIQGGPNHLKNWCDAPLIAGMVMNKS
jgi:glucosylceramidase